MGPGSGESGIEPCNKKVMAAYLLKRTLILIVTLIFVSIVVFGVLMVIPGTPLRSFWGSMPRRRL